MTDAGRPLVQAQPIDEVIQLLGQLRDCQLAAPQILELRAGVEALTEPGIGALYTCNGCRRSWPAIARRTAGKSPVRGKRSPGRAFVFPTG